MWARKRIDISWGDLFRGAVYVFSWRSRDAVQTATELAFSMDGDAIACLTERSGFDLLLGAQAFPHGSELLISAVTIDDMVRVIRKHGLVPVPVDVNPADMSPRLDLLEAARTPQTRAVLIAHLYGGRLDLQPVVDWARQHDVQIWEDCAQTFEGDRYLGHSATNVVLFSMGPIKTATSLGGGILVVRDQAVLGRMRQRQAEYPQQSRVAFLLRVAKYATIKVISKWLVFGILVRVCRLLGQDYDRVINGAVRNIPGDDLFAGLRQQPSVPLLRLMARRLRSCSPTLLARRAQKGRLLANLVRDRFTCPGADAPHHSFWVFPICIPHGTHGIAHLRDAGFDATTGSALQAVDPPDNRLDLTPTTVREMVSSTMFIPVYPEMPEAEVRRLGETILQLPN